MNETFWLEIADVVQVTMLVIAIAVQLVMLACIMQKRVKWRYTILPGGFLMHIAVFYIADLLRTAPPPSIFFLLWSSLLRAHAVAVVVVLSWLLFDMLRWTPQYK